MKKIPLVQAIAWIVGSTLFTCGTVHSVFKWYQKKAREEPQYIQSILQTGPYQEPLKTPYLAELLHLSVDRPSQSISFDVRRAQDILEKCPVIKEARVKLFNPTTLYIDYTIRKPIALLYDYENTAIDPEGYLFPLAPFFSPKNLPEIYLGLPASAPVPSLEKPLEGKEIALAFTLLNLLSDPRLSDLLCVRWIDVSQAFAESLGKREIILILEDVVIKQEHSKEVSFHFPRFLRLSTKTYAKELGNYLKLREELLASASKQLVISEKMLSVVTMPPLVVDLRLSQLAFLSGCKQKCGGEN